MAIVFLSIEYIRMLVTLYISRKIGTSVAIVTIIIKFLVPRNSAYYQLLLLLIAEISGLWWQLYPSLPGPSPLLRRSPQHTSAAQIRGLDFVSGHLLLCVWQRCALVPQLVNNMRHPDTGTAHHHDQHQPQTHHGQLGVGE